MRLRVWVRVRASVRVKVKIRVWFRIRVRDKASVSAGVWVRIKLRIRAECVPTMRARAPPVLLENVAPRPSATI